MQNDFVAELDFAPTHQRQVAVELVQHLENDASKIDRVGRRQGNVQLAQALVEGLRAEQCFQRRLGIVEIAVDTDYLQIVGRFRHHLQALHVRGAAIRIEAGDPDIGAIAKCFQRRGPGVAAGRGQNQELPILLPRQRRQDQAEGL